MTTPESREETFGVLFRALINRNKNGAPVKPCISYALQKPVSEELAKLFLLTNFHYSMMQSLIQKMVFLMITLLIYLKMMVQIKIQTL